MEGIRLNPHYVIWYKNVATLFVSLLIPFAFLAYWNLNTACVLRRRRRLQNRPLSIPNQPQSAENLEQGDNHSPGPFQESNGMSTMTAALMLNKTYLGSQNGRQRSLSDQGRYLKYKL